MVGMRTALKTSLVALPGLCLIGCAPPEAPRDLQQLACFIFDHTDDEEDEYLRVALENLNLWFDQDQEEDIEEGYQINLLVKEAVADLEGENHTLSDDLIGGAVATQSVFKVDDIVRATTVEDWESIIGEDQYEYYKRTFISGEDCIASRDCLRASARSESELVQLGISITSKNRIDFRWVETADGWAYIQRSWLTEPPVVSSDLVEPNSQYFLAVTLPRKPNVRLQATWIDTKIAGLQVPKSQVVKTMREQGEAIEEWMVDNY